MTRVALIVTGAVEHKALPESLERLFPGVSFEPLQLDSFTSCTLPPEPPLNGSTLVEKLARALVAAVDPGRQGEPADLAFLIDDLELTNTSAPERAIHHMRAAVRATMEARWSNAARRSVSEERVRERCSFHLLAPMVEAYFFGEPEALTRAGAKRPARFDPSARDVEDFITDDPDFLAAPNGRVPEWAKPHRAKHPKCYVQFLCDPAGQTKGAYREARGGYEALRCLDWDAVMRQAAHVRFARSLLLDLAEGLGRSDLTERLAGTSHELTSRPGRDPVLRNI